MFQDSMGKQIAGYRYGTYWFGAGKKISALCNVKYSSESQLVQDWDTANGAHSESPKLIRVYTDGTEKQLRPIPDAVVNRIMRDIEDGANLSNAQSVIAARDFHI